VLHRAQSESSWADEAARAVLLAADYITLVRTGFCSYLLGCGQPVAAWRGGLY
jgi:hypothetical protein